MVFDKVRSVSCRLYIVKNHLDMMSQPSHEWQHCSEPHSPLNVKLSIPNQQINSKVKQIYTVFLNPNILILILQKLLCWNFQKKKKHSCHIFKRHTTKFIQFFIGNIFYFYYVYQSVLFFSLFLILIGNIISIQFALRTSKSI